MAGRPTLERPTYQGLLRRAPRSPAIGGQPFDYAGARQRRRLVHRGSPDRIQMAMLHAFRGDTDLALQSLYDPMSIPPAHRGEFVEEVAPDVVDGAHQRGIVPALKRMLTDPLMWATFILSTRFPVGTRAQIGRYLKSGGEYGRRMGWLNRMTAPASESLRTAAGRTTNMGSLLVGGSIAKGRFADAPNRILQRGFDRFVELEGRTPNLQDKALVHIKLERWDDPSNVMLQSLSRTHGIPISQLGAKRFNLTRGQQELYKAFDEVRRSTYDEVFRPLDKLQREAVRGEFLSKGAMEIPTERGIGFYAPRFLSIDKATTARRMKEAIAAGHEEVAMRLADPAGLRRAMDWREYEALQMGTKIPVSMKERKFTLLPALSHLDEVAHVLKPRMRQAVQRTLKARGPDKPLVGTYSLDIVESGARYTESMARFRAFHMPHKPGSTKTRMDKIRDELKIVEKKDPVLASTIKNVYVPLAQGRMGPREFQRASAWQGQKVKWLRILHEHPFFRKGPAKEVADWLSTMIARSASIESRMNMQGSFTGYLYLSALGGNIAATFKNLMQTLGTTAPLLGTRNTMQGVMGTTKRLGAWWRLRRNHSPEEAFRKAFSEYAEAEAGLQHEIFGALENIWRKSATQGPAGRVAAKFKDVMMLPFQAVETWNRMVAFETGMIAAARAGVTGAGRLNFARMVVGETQFLAGAMMRPLAVAQAPPALRMFTQFPLRMANLYGNKFRQLFNADPQVRAEAVGFLARAGLMARGATEVIRETTAGLGAEIDPSGGLIPEGFPLPQMGTPFSPFPLVPPPISMAGSALIDMAEGQFEATKYTWPLGVPAGLGLTRFAATMGVDPLAEATKKKYADWNDRLDDGRVAMYTPQGQKIGYFTPWQVTLTALGFKVGDIAAEQEATAYVVKQRDIFRQFREELREAYAANNMTEFRRVADRFRRLYPNAPLMFKPSDVRAVKRRHMMTRLRVVLESAPVELRESLQMMAPMGVMGEVEQMSPPEPVQRIEQGLGMGAFP